MVNAYTFGGEAALRRDECLRQLHQLMQEIATLPEDHVIYDLSIQQLKNITTDEKRGVIGLAHAPKHEVAVPVW